MKILTHSCSSHYHWGQCREFSGTSVSPAAGPQYLEECRCCSSSSAAVGWNPDFSQCNHSMNKKQAHQPWIYSFFWQDPVMVLNTTDLSPNRLVGGWKNVPPPPPVFSFFSQSSSFQILCHGNDGITVWKPRWRKNNRYITSWAICSSNCVITMHGPL